MGGIRPFMVRQACPELAEGTDSVALTVVRDGENLEVSVTLGTWPEQPKVNINQRFFHREFPGGRELPDGPILPDFPREFRIPRYYHDFEIPGFSLPDLTPARP